MDELHDNENPPTGGEDIASDKTIFKSKRRKIAAIVAVCILVAAGIGVTIPLVTGSSSDANPSTAPPVAVADDFISRAIIPGLQHEETNGTVLVTSDEGIAYQVSANLTSRKSGVISLAEVQDLVKSVVCDSGTAHPATITIKFHSGELEPQDVKDMFPEDAILVINEDFFGTCFENVLSDGEAFGNISSDEELYQRIVGAGSGYLIVDSASLTASSIVVTGARAHFFSMFEEGHFTIREIENPSRRELLLLSLQIRKKWNPILFMVVETIGTVSSDCRMESVVSDFGWWGFEMSVKLSLEVIFEFNLDMTMEVGLQGSVPLNITNLVSSQVSPPPLKLLNLVSKVGKKVGLLGKLDKLPELKLGLYLEVVLLLELFEVQLVYDFGPYLDVDLTTGRKGVDLFFVYRPFSGIISIDADMISTDPSLNYTFGIKPLQDQISVEVSAFFGVRPQVMVYLTEYIGAGISLTDAGAELKTKYAVNGALGPVESQQDVVVVGPCQTCHIFEADLSAILRGPKLNAYIQIPKPESLWNITNFFLTKRFSKDLLGADVSLRWKVLSLCLWKEFDEHTITCGTTCCNSSYQLCESEMCVDDETTDLPTTEPPTTKPTTMEQPTTEAPITEPPTTEQSTTIPPIPTEQPTTEPPTTEQPTTEPPTEERCTEEDFYGQCCNDGILCDEEGFVCDQGFCLSSGNPRFTLSWFGNDWLDLLVLPPDGSLLIDFLNDFDEESQGRLEKDVRPDGEGWWVENIYFPIDDLAPEGVYQYAVRNYRKNGEADQWTVTVYFGKDFVESHTGKLDQGLLNGFEIEFVK